MNSEERAKRLAAMKEEKERQLRQRKMVKKYAPYVAGGLCVLLVVGVIIGKTVTKNTNVNDTDVVNGITVADSEKIEAENEIIDKELVDTSNEQLQGDSNELENLANEEPIPTSVNVDGLDFVYGYKADYSGSVQDLPEDENKVASEFGILIDLNSGEVVAGKKSRELMYPASMTKVLTVLVAAENIPEEKLDDLYTITLEATDYSYVHKCSNVGYLEGEITTVRDLFYGTILPSGGDAAYSLACLVAGSHEAFVELMNKKIEELGLSDTTHFTNCVGIYDKEHYTTAYDMAMIMKAAVENDFVRDVLSAHTYTTSISKEHVEGITISNWFLRRIEDKIGSGEVVGAKTGFVNQSGCCAVSYYVSETNTPYICVTGNAFSSWRAIYDHQYIYDTYTK